MLQPVPLLFGGVPPPRRGGILQGGNSWRPCHKMQLLGTKAMRPYSVRRANFEVAHDETARSMCSLIDSCGFRSTPSTFSSSTRSAPGMIGSAGGWTRVERRRPTTIVSFVFDGWIFKLFFSAHELILSYSSERMERRHRLWWVVGLCKIRWCGGWKYHKYAYHYLGSRTLPSGTFPPDVYPREKCK